MSAKRFRLTKTAKLLIFVLIIALVGGGVFAAFKTGFVKNSDMKAETNKDIDLDKISSIDTDEDGNVINTKKDTESTINLSLDEWIGWKPIIDSNGGLTTQDGSIYDELGIKVNISIINDAAQSSNALISGNLDAAGYTINRTAFLSQKFKEANTDVIMPYISNYSNGGDGIIAKSSIQSVSDLVDAKIGVPQFSEAHSLVVWFVNQSDLSTEDKETILNNLTYFTTPDEAAKAFFAGQIDVAATWEPYLTQAQNMTDAHILFSTASSSSLIMDGILFNREFAETHPEVVSAFIDGALQAMDLYETDLNTIKEVMPMFSVASNEDILSNCAAAKLATYKDNLNLMNGTAKTIYTGMCGVWDSIGESVNYDLVNTIFDNTYLNMLSEKYANDTSTSVQKVEVTEETMTDIEDTVALLEKSAAKLATYKDNLNLMNGTAKTIYTGMCGVWDSIGESVNYDLVNTIFDNTYLNMLSEKYANDTSTSVQKVEVTEETMTDIEDTVALLEKSASVNFIINTAKFSDSIAATEALNEFIEIAKVLDGTIIEIAGNTDPNPTSDPEDVANKLLSQNRAETVKQYFVMNGIDAKRIITIGNGSSNPIVENDTEEHRAMNRRTDVSFKCIE